jgi:serine/threonine protein phosphatase PrpC
MVVCPHCGSASADPDFCDACNRELQAAPTADPALLPERLTLADGRTVDCSAWRGVWPPDCGRALPAWSDGQPYRLYALNPAWWRDLGPAVRQRADCALDVLAPVEVIPIGAGAVVAAATLLDARRALGVPSPPGDLLTLLDDVVRACRTLAAALEPLHGAGLVWLNFDPDCLETADGRLQITNLDLQLFRAGDCPQSLRLSSAYSPPEVCRFQSERIGPASDVYHLSLYAYYQLAGLLPVGFPGGGLEAFDFEVPPLRIYRPHLPVGIVPVLERGLARDPAGRYPSVADFLRALEEGVERARAHGKREGEAPAEPQAAGWDVGGLSVTGRAKAALGRPNQDTLRLEPLASGEAPLVLVADGVSHARIGSGELASRLGCEVLARVLPPALAGAATRAEIEEALRSAFLEASGAVLAGALTEQGPLPDAVEAHDLMSTTALVGLLRRGVLTVANLGDSRAYLLSPVEGGMDIEQLTVDGDVGCALLAWGTPPEQVRDMGNDALALCACLGVCEPAPGGGFRCAVERSTPQVTHWPLSSGQVVLLCTDGLIEEGAFLEPAQAAALVARHADLPAQELAERLVAAADTCQRLPSEGEPEGHGDNITCVVIKSGG